FDRVDIPTLGVVENMSYFECSGCGAVHNIFSHGGATKLAKELGVPVLGEIPIEVSTRESGDTGRPEVLSNPESKASKAFFKLTKRIATMLAKQAFGSGRKAPGGAGGLRIIQ